MFDNDLVKEKGMRGFSKPSNLLFSLEISVLCSGLWGGYDDLIIYYLL